MKNTPIIININWEEFKEKIQDLGDYPTSSDMILTFYKTYITDWDDYDGEFQFSPTKVKISEDMNKKLFQFGIDLDKEYNYNTAKDGRGEIFKGGGVMNYGPSSFQDKDMETPKEEDIIYYYPHSKKTQKIIN